MDYRLKNVLVMGVSFHLIYFAYDNSVSIQQTVLNSFALEGEAKINGYYIAGITDITFALANWLIGPLLKFTGLKFGMIIGTLAYIPYPAMFLFPNIDLLYAAAILLGVGGALNWSAQGSFIGKNTRAREATGRRDVAIFWALYESHYILGNIFIFFAFSQESEVISDETRFIVYGYLFVIGTLGTLLLFLLESKTEEDDESGKELSVKSAARLIKTTDIFLLVPSFFLTGLLSAFPTGVWTTAIAATKQFGLNSKKYIGLSGIFLGIGEVIGGLFFGFGWGRTFERDSVVTVSFILNALSLGIIFIHMPPNASLIGEESYLSPVIEPNIWLAVLSSLLFGLCEAALNTQIYDHLIGVYSTHPVAAFGIYKCLQAIGSALTYLYSTTVNLYSHIVILAMLGFLSTMGFCFAEWRFRSWQNIQTIDSTT